jgi:hypothetical protein|tara:strand:+ start:328 stop:528 length:201 start_codon:yes stop_codon:yes gene_type:complete
MADVIKELFTLPREQQEFILENMSHEYTPIEINGEVFMIPKEVHELIDNLVRQISNPKESIAKEAH